MNKIYFFIVFVIVVLTGMLYLTRSEKGQDAQMIVVVDHKKAEPLIEDKQTKILDNVPETHTAPVPVKILLVGDLFFDRYIRQVGNKKGEDFIFSCIDGLLSNFDLVVGNLEGPITDNDSISMGSIIGNPENYVFTFPTTSANVLSHHNIGLVNLGNNHIGNFGLSGIASTQNYLKMAGVNYFGGLNGDEPTYQIGNISFVSYNEFGGQSPEKISSMIVDEKTKGNTVIVYAHWGEEYMDPVSKMHDVAKLFADNGADVVVGSHPHIVLSREYIGKTLVYYSLGNFIFDQYWDPKVTSGLAVALEISDGHISAKEHPITLESDGRTCPN